MEQLKVEFVINVSKWLIDDATLYAKSIKQKKIASMLINTINTLLDENAITQADIAIQFSDGKVLFVDSSVPVTDDQLRRKNAAFIDSLINDPNHELVSYLNSVLNNLIELTIESLRDGCFALAFTKQLLDQTKIESA